MPRIEQIKLGKFGGGKSVGGKALGLQHVQEAGLQVPPFEVSPDDLEATVRRLGFPLAVRSSASLEDGGRDSFAGQFDSFLNLTSLEQVSDAVQACLASTKAPSVRSYCQQRGLDASQLKMEVIVQRLVQPTLAGVAFGVNPATGEERVVIEACEGLADRLLAGSDSSLAQDHPLMRRHAPQVEDAVRLLQEYFGCPQDVEFALEDDQLFILQARPITSIRFALENGEWTNADFRDGGVSARVCSPLMWSLYQWIWDDSLKETLREIRLFARDFQASRMFFGRPYWNLGEVKRCLERVPGYVEREFDTDLSVQINYDGEGRRTPTNLITVAKALPVAWGIHAFFKRQQKAAEHLLTNGWGKIRRRLADTRQDDGECFADLIERDYRHVETVYFRTVFAVSLAKLDFKMAFPDSDYVALVTGQPALSHMAPQLRIQQMKSEGRRDPAALAEEFRHHCRWGVDVIHPRWDEDLEFVASLMATDDERTTSNTGERFEQVKSAAVQSLPRGKRASFLRKLDRLRGFIWLREELRDISNQMYYEIRRAALRIAEQHFLDDDVFFMSWREIVADDRSNIERNREVYASYRNYRPPNEIGRNLREAPRVQNANDQWRGIGVSGGSVTGVARIACSVEQAMQVEPGSILVCPYTEPGWTPALARVSGVVTETGGLLSHAAVICREYGLPAVLAVEHATELLRDGDVLQIDGDRGQVLRAERKSEN